MAGIEIISENKLRSIAGERGLNQIYLEKDYFLTLILYLLKDVDGLYFKGGTALNKIFLNHARLSEDLDFSCNRGIATIRETILKTITESKLFYKHEFDKNTETFFRLIPHYKSYFAGNSYIMLDVNAKASIHIAPERHTVPHFYDSIPKFEVSTLAAEELIAEKIAALISRNQPRDYFDTYLLLKNGHRINKKLLNLKLKESGQEFNPERIFKNAKKIYSKWDSDIGQLTNQPVDYMTVIQYLQKEFGYKSHSPPTSKITLKSPLSYSR